MVSKVKKVKEAQTPETEKVKEAQTPETEKVQVEYEERILNICPIASPLASKKLTKKILKLVKKASKDKSVKRGVKEVVKGLRKKVQGIVFIAGDISPIDVISHLPVLCEDHSIPYVYVPSKEDLGSQGSTKRPTSVVMVTYADNAEFQDSYKEVADEMLKLGEILASVR